MKFIKGFLFFNNRSDESYWMKRIVMHVRNRYYIILDLLIFTFLPLMAFYIRYDGLNIPLTISSVLLLGFSLGLAKVIVLYFAGMYSRWWANASIGDLLLIIYSGILILLLQVLLLLCFKSIPIEPFHLVPFSVIILDSIFSGLFVSFSRLSLRIFSHQSMMRLFSQKEKHTRALIVGAGDAGIVVMEELLRNHTGNMNIAGFIDDDDRKLGMKIRGVKVLGNRHSIPGVVKEYNVKKLLLLSLLWVAVR